MGQRELTLILVKESMKILDTIGHDIGQRELTLIVFDLLMEF